MNQRSIRFRLATWYSLALAASLLLLALAIWLSMWQTLVRDIDSTLADRGRSVESYLNEELRDPGVKLPEELDEYSHALPATTLLRITDASGAVVFTSPGEFPWRLAEPDDPSVRRIEWQRQAYRVLVRKVSVNGRAWTVFLAASLDAPEHMVNRLGLLLLMLTPAVIFIATTGGIWLSRRALKPVDELTAAARSIGIENLSKRLVIPQTGDELQRLSETWNSMLSRLENAVNRLSRFTADASHELRTPLAVIRSTAEIAARKPRSAEQYRDALAQIVAESERMTGLVEDLLFLARCDAETPEMPMSPLDLAAIVRDVCSRMLLVAESHGTRLECYGSDSGLFILGNEAAVRRLVLVLVDNAIKYSGAGKAVAVTLCGLDHEIHLAVEDNGTGIDEADLPRIFERFYRALKVHEPANNGCGLGLALASSIAQHHGAAIRVASAVGAGSTFSVVFPAAAERTALVADNQNFECSR